MGGMKRAPIRIFCLFAALIALSNCAPKAPSNSADPVTGTWGGEWGPSPERQTEVRLELKWDGTKLQGTVNPGYNAIELTKASFDPQTGKIKMELDGPNSHREIVRYVIEGTLSGTTMSGTFDRAGERGTFKIEKN
jgi:hypothetical protein